MKILKPDGRANICGIQMRKIRRSEKLSQEELAAKLQVTGLNVTQKSISRMETGKRVITDYELIYIAKALDATIYYLLGLEGASQENKRYDNKNSDSENNETVETSETTKNPEISGRKITPETDHKI